MTCFLCSAHTSFISSLNKGTPRVSVAAARERRRESMGSLFPVSFFDNAWLFPLCRWLSLQPIHSVIALRQMPIPGILLSPATWCHPHPIQICNWKGLHIIIRLNVYMHAGTHIQLCSHYTFRCTSSASNARCRV